jgi:hypothetical protein
MKGCSAKGMKGKDKKEAMAYKPEKSKPKAKAKKK